MGWINVAPDLQIRVIEAYACGDFYDYVTEVRSLTGVVGSLRIPTHVGTGDWVGDHVAIRTNLSGKSVTAYFDNDVGSSPYMQFVAVCTGSWGGRGNALDGYDKIRHTIAIHPVEVKIPFELRDIPIPSVEPVVR